MKPIKFFSSILVIIFLLAIIYIGYCWQLGKKSDEHLKIINHSNNIFEVLQQSATNEMSGIPTISLTEKENLSSHGIFRSKQIYAININNRELPVALIVDINHSPLSNGLNRYKAIYSLDLSSLKNKNNMLLNTLLSGFNGKNPLSITEKIGLFDSTHTKFSLNIAPYKAKLQQDPIDLDIDFSGYNYNVNATSSKIKTDSDLKNLALLFKFQGKEIVNLLLNDYQGRTVDKGKNFSFANYISPSDDFYLTKSENKQSLAQLKLKLNLATFNLTPAVVRNIPVSLELSKLQLVYNTTEKDSFNANLSIKQFDINKLDQALSLNKIKGNLDFSNKNLIKNFNLLLKSSTTQDEKLLFQALKQLAGNAIVGLNFDFMNANSAKFKLVADAELKAKPLAGNQPFKAVNLSLKTNKGLITQLLQFVNTPQDEIQDLFASYFIEKSKDTLSLEYKLKNEVHKLNGAAIPAP